MMPGARNGWRDAIAAATSSRNAAVDRLHGSVRARTIRPISPDETTVLAPIGEAIQSATAAVLPAS